MNEEKRYYFIRSRGLAEALRYISQSSYLTFEDKHDNTRQVYSFEDSQQFQNLLSDINALCKKYRD